MCGFLSISGQGRDCIKMSKRERDIGRSYMTGSQKRAKKAKADAERLKQSGSLLKLFKSTEAAPVNPPTDHVVHPEKITVSEIHSLGVGQTVFPDPVYTDHAIILV